MLDLIIKNAKIVDGTGNPWYRGDVGVAEGRIAVLGTVDQECRELFDAGGRMVAPGFIDGHCHSDLMILNHPESEIKLRQGVTTEVVGNCGLAPAPYIKGREALLQSYVGSVLGPSFDGWSWESVGEYLHTVQNRRPSSNLSTFVAHGVLRIAVMGFDQRPATDKEIRQMQLLLEEGMRAGAIGLSIGLLYAPGSYAAKEEIARLCSVLPAYGGLLSTHIRGEGNHLVSSIEEVIWIAEHSGVPLHVSHLKAAGKSNWGKILQAMELIENARSRGLDVTCDVYPYTAGSTTLTTVLPPWVLEGGTEAALARMSDPGTRKLILNELASEQKDWDNLVASTGWDSIYLSSVRSAANAGLEGRNILDISRERGTDPASCALDLLLEENGQITIVYFHMSDSDVRQVIGWDRSFIASDSLHCETGKPHPRLYGTFPRLLGKYVREERLLSMEQAVRKLTSFPAARFRLGKRGLLAPGYEADLVVFDPDRIRDTASYEQPKQYPEGIAGVWVGGVRTIDADRHTHARAGRIVASGSCCGSPL